MNDEIALECMIDIGALIRYSETGLCASIQKPRKTMRVNESVNTG
jgi:hypothetical protein